MQQRNTLYGMGIVFIIMLLMSVGIPSERVMPNTATNSHNLLLMGLIF